MLRFIKDWLVKQASTTPNLTRFQTISGLAYIGALITFAYFALMYVIPLFAYILFKEILHIDIDWIYAK